MPTAVPLPSPLRAVLFDLDGTLCDSEDGIVSHLGRALATVGLPVPGRDALRACVGPPWHHGLDLIGVPIDRVPDVIAAYRATYDDEAPGLAPPFPGVAEALARLHDAGLAMAVATSKPQHLAVRIVSGGPLARYLPTVVGADPDAGRHTKADSVAGALAAVRLDGPVVMVGDRHHDVDGARAHGLDTIGVRWGTAAPGELEAAGALAVVDSPTQLADLLLAVA